MIHEHVEIIKQNNTMKLYLDKIEISEIFTMFRKNIDLFILKIPLNYDFDYFIQN